MPLGETRPSAPLTAAAVHGADIITVPNTAWSAEPFSGSFKLPDGINPATSRVFVEIDGPTTEAAARVTVNGTEAGGFIGRPYRLDITRHLKAGENKLRVLPFAPGSVRLILMNS